MGKLEDNGGRIRFISTGRRVCPPSIPRPYPRRRISLICVGFFLLRLSYLSCGLLTAMLSDISVDNISSP